MGRRGGTTSYAPMTFEEFYTRQLDTLKVALKDIIRAGLPFVTSPEYACKKCARRLKLYTDGQTFCLMCDPLPAYWSKETRARVTTILEGYPDRSHLRQEWHPTPREQSQGATAECVAFGAHVEEARQQRGMTQEQLASKIFKRDATNISLATVRMIEKGQQNCSPLVREQLVAVLGLGK
jgi:DNA-binding XRE family transcriptional regulator